MSDQPANVNRRTYSIKELAPFLLATVIVFTVCLSFGLISSPSESGEVFDDLAETLEPLLALGPLELCIAIFLNNAIKTLIALVSGIALGLPTLLFISFNGYLIGLLVSVIRPATSPLVITASIAPHGII